MGPRTHVMEKESHTRHLRWKQTRLQIHRIRKGMTLTEAASQLNITRGYLNTLEMGRSDPSLLIALRIAALYGVSISDLWLSPA